jgi:transposase
MRGSPLQQVTMLSTVTPDQLIPADHPIRRIKPIVDEALRAIGPHLDAMYAEVGRPSIPPEHLLKGSILMALYSIRSERQFCERLQYDLLFKWFLDLNVETPGFEHSSFSKNRERLLEQDVAAQFFAAVLAQAKRRRPLSNQHFTVDGTLLEAWASFKSLRPRDDNRRPPAEGGDAGRNPEVDCRGERRSNETHFSATDPDARLARKGPGREAKLALAGHVLMENRSGLVMKVLVTQATGTAEREAALQMVARLKGRRRRRLTLGGDKGYDTADFVRDCRQLGVTPHVAQNTTRQRSAIDGRTVRHVGYQLSQRVRQRVEEIYGWVKTVGGGRKLRYCGVRINQLWAELAATAYNLVGMANLLTQPA